MFQRLLRYSNAGILDFQVKILMVCIQCHMNPALFLVILDRIFDQVGKCKCDLYLIHLRTDRAEAL